MAQTALYVALFLPGLNEDVLGLYVYEIHSWGWFLAIMGSLACLVLCEIYKFVASKVGRCRLTLSKRTLKPPGTKRLKLQYDEPLSNFAFKFKLRRYTKYITVAKMANYDAALDGVKTAGAQHSSAIQLNLHYSAQLEPFLTQKHTLNTPQTPYHPLNTP